MPPPPPPPPPSVAPPIPPPCDRPPCEATEGDAGAIARAAIEAKETGILDLNNSGLAKFPVGVIKLAGDDISTVDISNNRLQSLPGDFGTFSKVEKIVACGNRFSRFAVAFVTIPTLEFLDLSENNYSSLAEEELKRFPSKCQIVLKNNPLDDASKKLAQKYNIIL